MEKEKQEIHHEDLALKTAAQYFGEELMPLMGISGAIALIAPTESVSWKHVRCTRTLTM